MMMVSLQPRTRDNTNSVLVRIGVGVVVLLFAYGVSPYVRDLYEVLVTATDQGPYARLSRAEMVTRLADAEQEIQRIRYQAVLYGQLADEYTALQRTVALRSDQAYATARVIARPPQSQYDTLTLAHGTDHDARVGDTVQVERFVLGFITSNSARTSVVTLNSSPGTQHTALVGTERVPVIVTGTGAGSMTASIPRSAGVKVGDMVIDERTGLVSGLVRVIDEDISNVAHTVLIAVPIHSTTLRTVDIVRTEL